MSRKTAYGKFYKADGENMALQHNGKIEIPPKGSLIHIITPEQQEKRRKNAERAREAEKFNSEVQNISKEHGGFTWLRTDYFLNELKPQTVGRLAYLSTFLDFENQLLLKLNNQPMLKGDLAEVLGVTKRTTQDFYKELTEEKILIDKGKDGLYLSKIFWRGRTTDKKKIRLYRSTIRELYGKMSIKGHRFFGYVIQLIPYFNREWNVICSNPEETDMMKIDFLSIGEICKLLNFNKSNSDRLKAALTGNYFVWNGSKQSICAILKVQSCGTHFETIIVNPHLIFAGTDYKKVESKGIFFPVKTCKATSEE